MVNFYEPNSQDNYLTNGGTFDSGGEVDTLADELREDLGYPVEKKVQQECSNEDSQQDPE